MTDRGRHGRAVLSRSPLYVAVLEGAEHRVRSLNDAAVRVLGRERIVGRPLAELLPEALNAHLGELDEVLQRGEGIAADALQINDVFLNVAVDPVVNENGRVGLRLSAWDVTIHELQRRRLADVASELEAANRAKDEFLATVAHELRTPLNAILGWVRILRLQPADASSLSRTLDTLERNGLAQAKVIEDLLDVGRIISGKLWLELAPVDMPALALSCVNSVELSARAKSIELRHHVEEPLVAVADVARLQQVITNLLTNAIKFTPQGGSVELQIHKTPESIDVVVKDTGKGIAPELLGTIFERFRQVDSSQSAAGLGLGLAIARHITELHGGSLLAESAGVGLGSTFTVRLPLRPLSTSQVSAPSTIRLTPSGKGADLTGVSVLIVDDEPDSRELLVAALGGRNATVLAASSAEEAFERILEHKPQVLVSDIAMPGQDGYELIRRIRALPTHEGGATAAIALTAYTRFEDRARALVAGFDVHLPKPVDHGDLINRIASLARG